MKLTKVIAVAALPGSSRSASPGMLTLLVACYAAIAGAATWPLVLHLGTSLPGQAADQTHYMWCVDTFWAQIFAGRNPFWTDRVLYPVGVNLLHDTYAPFVSLFGLPFLSNLLLYFALVVVVSLVAAAVGMERLVYAVTNDRAAAAVAGLFYGFSPALVSVVEASHYYTVVAAALLPFAFLALVRFLQGRGRALLSVSAIMWALVFTDYYVTLLFFIMAIVFALNWLTSLTATQWRQIGLAAFANIALALLVSQVLPPFDTSDLPPGGEGFWSSSHINLIDTVIPRAENVVLGATLQTWGADRHNNEIDYFLGWGILGLALYGAARTQYGRVRLGFAAAGIACLALACGTRVQWGTATLLEGQWTPWSWLMHVSLLKSLDSPRRFVLGTEFAIAALAGLGLAGHRRALGAAPLLLLLEYGQIGMPSATFPVPEVYRWLAESADSRTLLELPSGITESKGGFGLNYGNVQNNPQMYWQTIHHKPRVGGYLSRIPRSTYGWFEHEPVIRDLFTFTSEQHVWGGETITQLPAYEPEVVSQFVRTFNLGYVIVPAHPQRDEFIAAVENLMAGRIAMRQEDSEGYALFTLADIGDERSEDGEKPSAGLPGTMVGEASDGARRRPPVSRRAEMVAGGAVKIGCVVGESRFEAERLSTVACR